MISRRFSSLSTTIAKSLQALEGNERIQTLRKASDFVHTAHQKAHNEISSAMIDWFLMGDRGVEAVFCSGTPFCISAIARVLDPPVKCYTHGRDPGDTKGPAQAWRQTVSQTPPPSAVGGQGCGVSGSNSANPNPNCSNSTPLSKPGTPPAANKHYAYPSLTLLESGIDMALDDVKLYRYTLPRELHDALGLDNRKYSRIYFALEIRLWELLPSASFTKDPEEADFFVVPHALIANVFNLDPPHTKQLYAKYVEHGLRPLFRYLVEDRPYYNRSGGRDHLFVYAMDGDFMPGEWGLTDGVLKDPFMGPIFGNLTKVAYYGQYEGTTAAVGTPGWRPAGWRPGPQEWRVGHDIALPMFNTFYNREHVSSDKVLSRCSPQSHMFFAGARTNSGPYSHGIRPWLAATWAPQCGDDCMILSGSIPRTTMFPAWFGLAPTGWGIWSTRLFDYIDRLAIPVILANSADEPFEKFLDWEGFAVRPNTDALMDVAHNPCLNLSSLLSDWHGRKCTYSGVDGSGSNGLNEDRRAMMAISAAAKAMNLHCTSDVCTGVRNAGTAHGGTDRIVAGQQHDSVCAGLPGAKMVRRLEAVRPFFAWDPATRKSAWGMFALSLFCLKLRQLDELARHTELCGNWGRDAGDNPRYFSTFA